METYPVTISYPKLSVSHSSTVGVSSGGKSVGFSDGSSAVTAAATGASFTAAAPGEGAALLLLLDVNASDCGAIWTTSSPPDAVARLSSGGAFAELCMGKSILERRA